MRRRIPALLLALLIPAALAHEPLLERAAPPRHFDHVVARRDAILSGIVPPVSPTVTTSSAAVSDPLSTTSSSSSIAVIPPLLTTLPTTTTTLASVPLSSTISTTPVVLPTTTPPAVVLPPVVPNTTSSDTPAHVSSTTHADLSSKVSEVVVTVTSVVTNPDGSTSTATSLQETTTPVVNRSSNNARTWGIVGGVCGGIVVILFLIFIVWRFSQRRFSDVDANGDEIKWPELQPDGTAPMSTLNPMGTRRTGGAGIEMGNEKDEDWDDVAGAGSGRQSYYELGPGGMGSAASVDQLVAYGNSSSNQGYYDSYLGLSAAPQPMPPTLYPPSPHPPSNSPRSFSPPTYYSGDGHSIQALSDQGHTSPPRAMSPPLLTGGRTSPGPNRMG